MAGNSLAIREISTREEWVALYPLLRQTNPDMNKATFTARLREMRRQGYRCAGAFVKGKLVGIAGFWCGTRFWCGKYIDIDNVVVDEKHRSRGIGEKLMEWVEEEGKRQGCDIAVLDSYTTFHGAHKFYFRQGYVILGYHFTKKY